MIEIIPFKPEHLEQIDLKENYNRADCPKTVVHTAFTLMDGETILAIMGGFPFVPGVVHFWAWIGKGVRRKPIAFQKKCLEVIEWYEKNEKPRRIQWEVRADYEVGCRWAESLGLRREGLLRKWAPDGSDCYLYARVN
jgi:hypothetical protein